MTPVVDFLKTLAPTGPWWICEIVPDGDLSGAGYTPSQLPDLEQRTVARNTSANIYYQPNFVGIPPKNGKATKDSITAVRALFVDCDPRVNEDWQEERRRMLVRLSSFVPAPSIIVSSGRGYQGIWLLAEPVGLGAGDVREAAVADVESRLRWLANELEGDFAVAQIAALLRLPGLTAHPNKKKRAQGFKDPLPTEITVADNGRRYSLSDFKTTGAATPRSSLAGVSLPEKLRTIDVQMLDQWDATGRLKALAMHGHRVCEPPLNLDPPKLGDNSRSAWLFDFVCNAVRAKVPAEVIAGILLDRANGIAESVLEKRNPRRYATQQLDRAIAKVNAGPGRHELTDIGNGRRLVLAANGLFRFCFGTGVWFGYDDGRWRVDDGGAVQALCKLTALGIKDEIQNGDDKDAISRTLKWASQSQGKERLTAMAWTARDEVAVDVDELDADQWLLNCRNGTVDLKTGAMRRHDPGDLLTKQAAVDFVPGAECPLFLRFVGEVMQADDAMVAYLQRAIGYSLTGDTREQVFFLPYGGGANGKSTLLKIVTAMMGSYAHTAQMSAFIAQDRFNDGPNEALAAMRGARLVIAAEIKPGAPLDEQTVKSITGGDRIRARFLHQNSFEYDPTFKVWLVVNHLPSIRSQDHGMWRRVRVVPFERQFALDEQDKTLGDRIIASELPGVLNWALAGCLAWQRDGLGGADRIAAATRTYKTESDVLAQWIEDCCIIAPDERVPVKQACGSYYGWCERTGERPLPRRALGDALVAKGFRSASLRFYGAKERCFVGIGLRDRRPAEMEAQGGSHEMPF